MDIYPQDLGQKYGNRVLHWRGLFSGTIMDSGLDILDSAAIAHGRSNNSFTFALWGFVAGNFVSLIHSSSSIWTSFFLDGGIGAGLGYICGSIMDRRNLNKQRIRKVTTREVQILNKGEPDRLKQDYLSLVSFLISARAGYDSSEEESIRIAIRSLGMAVENLPNQPSESILLDPETLKAQAARLTAEVAHETDPVIAASLERQSLTLTQSAETIMRNANLLRRNLVLRNEIGMQIKALQTSVSASEIGDDGGSLELGNLASRIQQVATEANTLAEARVELDAALNIPLLSS